MRRQNLALGGLGTGQKMATRVTTLHIDNQQHKDESSIGGTAKQREMKSPTFRDRANIVKPNSMSVQKMLIPKLNMGGLKVNNFAIQLNDV